MEKHPPSKTVESSPAPVTSDSSATAVASESLVEMVQEMESQLNHVMDSPLLNNDANDHVLKRRDTEEADAFGEVTPVRFDGNGEVVVKTLDVPKWLSDEQSVEYLNKSIAEKNLEKEYECIVELSGLGTSNVNSDNNTHLLITMKGTNTRQLGRARRSLENILIAHVDNINRKNDTNNNDVPYPPSLGRLLYSLALSATDNSPRWRDQNAYRTVLGRAKLPLFTGNKVWMNIVELPKDDEGNHHGVFLAGRGGRLFETYKERFGCRVDVYGDFTKKEDAKKKDYHALPLLCDPYVLVTSKDSKANVDSCLQFIEHRILEHSEKFGVGRTAEVEKVGKERRMRRMNNKKEGGQQSRGRSGGGGERTKEENEE